MVVAREYLGHGPEFPIDPLAYAGAQAVVQFLLLGVLAGLAAVAYNRTLLFMIAAADGRQFWPVEVRAAIVGGAAGALAWLAPDLVGGGDVLVRQALTSSPSLAFLALVFPLRFVFGAVSYAARTPGGLFAPMLVLGAHLGLMFAAVCAFVLPHAGPPPVAFAVVGMAAFFTGVVRSPVTGLALIIELTAGFPLLLPMLVACFAAMLVPGLLRSKPIYESLSITAIDR
jgi:CIC family chloride channel protein